MNTYCNYYSFNNQKVSKLYKSDGRPVEVMTTFWSSRSHIWVGYGLEVVVYNSVV